MTWLKMPLKSRREERHARCEKPQLEDLDLLLCAVAALKEDFQATNPQVKAFQRSKKHKKAVYHTVYLYMNRRR